MGEGRRSGRSSGRPGRQERSGDGNGLRWEVGCMQIRPRGGRWPRGGNIARRGGARCGMGMAGARRGGMHRSYGRSSGRGAPWGDVGTSRSSVRRALRGGLELGEGHDSEEHCGGGAAWRGVARHIVEKVRREEAMVWRRRGEILAGGIYRVHELRKFL